MDPEELQKQISLLPAELRDYVLQLPIEKQAEVVQQVVQATELSFRQLQEEDISLIQAATEERGAYGFISDDLDLSWDDVGSENYISIAAFEERAGLEVPVAFIIAEVSRLENTKDVYLEGEPASSLPPAPPSDSDPSSSGSGGSSSSSSSNIATTTTTTNNNNNNSNLDIANNSGIASTTSTTSTSNDCSSTTSNSNSNNVGSSDSSVGGSTSGDNTSANVYSLLQGCGFEPSDTVLSIYFLGVDYQFRRQGFGRQLMDIVKGVAQEARARMIWLNVAEHNPEAISFYLSCGFKNVNSVQLGSLGKHAILVYPLEAPPRSTTTGSRGKRSKLGGRQKAKKGSSSRKESSSRRPKAMAAAPTCMIGSNPCPKPQTTAQVLSPHTPRRAHATFPCSPPQVPLSHTLPRRGLATFRLPNVFRPSHTECTAVVPGFGRIR